MARARYEDSVQIVLLDETVLQSYKVSFLRFENRI